MPLPSFFPDPGRSEKLIGDLLERVRKLDPSAKRKLVDLLENEADLPMLDKLERGYRERVMATLSKVTDRKSANDLGNALRAHFNKNLVLQREYLHDLVRKTLQSSLEAEATPVRTEAGAGEAATGAEPTALGTDTRSE
jgi:hypothetical protein